jgi:hypothetical protein
MHSALKELGLIGMVDEINEPRLRAQDAFEPILISTNGTILAGFERWRRALFEGKSEIDCIEYPLDESESLQFILTHHRPRRGWNAFVRIQLALTLEPLFQQKAIENMRAGGRYKGLASLPEAHHIDVRQEIARIAQVGARGVSNAKKILEAAHPRLIAALRDGRLTINAAIQLCKLSKARQVEEFARRLEDAAIGKVIRRWVAPPQQVRDSPDVVTILDALRRQEARHPGSVVVQASELSHTTILIGQDLFGTDSQGHGRLT